MNAWGKRNKTIKDGDIAPWKDLQKKLNKDKKKRTKKKLYFDMGRIVKRKHFLYVGLRAFGHAFAEYVADMKVDDSLWNLLTLDVLLLTLY